MLNQILIFVGGTYKEVIALRITTFNTFTARNVDEITLGIIKIRKWNGRRKNTTKTRVRKTLKIDTHN